MELDDKKFPQTKRKFYSGRILGRSENRRHVKKIDGAPEEIRTPDPQIRSLSAARAGGVELNDIRSNPPICTTWPPIQRPQHQLVHLGSALCDRDGSFELIARLAVREIFDACH